MRDPRRSTPRQHRWPYVVGFGVAIFAVAVLLRRPGSLSSSPATSAGARLPAATLTPEVLDEFLAIERREKEVLQSTWSHEVAADQWGSRIEAFWNHLNAHRGEWAPLLELPRRSLEVPEFPELQSLPFQIQFANATNGSRRIPLSKTDARLSRWAAEGWGLVQSEWRHIRFEPATESRLPASTYEVNLHFTRPAPESRVQISARARFEWPSRTPETGDPVEPAITVESLQFLRRDGPSAFQEVAAFDVPPFPRTSWIDPLIAVTGDTPQPERFLLAARNLQVVRDAQGTWTATPFADHHPGLVFTALFADFTSDGHDDILFAVRNGLVLLAGDSDRTFRTPPKPAWLAPERLHYAQALTCGDFDRDGDLDLFLGQYRTPYESGQMPRPFFDALDGPPAFLLRNKGTGTFEDVTAGSGLELKRHRRSYGASFVDLDGDSDLDLLVTSDFAGCDVYANDGSGRFSDRSQTWLDGVRAFGMSHTLSDFDADGALDFLVAGMPQPTADRLNAWQLDRDVDPAWRTERSRVVTGNRLMFGGADGFRQRPVGATVARSGWAWSAAAPDLNNDRWPEIYVVNGHESRASVRDYEREFWLHDIYVGSSQPNPAVDAYFASKFASTRSQGWSYGGYDKNRLFLNLGVQGFLDAGHVLGLAYELDGRNVLAEDIDGDGDTDLLLSTSEVIDTPRQTLRILENTLPHAGNWIAIRPGSRTTSSSNVGATVVLSDSAGRQARTWVTGDGYRSQSSRWMRFGLGAIPQVDQVEVRWPDGRRSVVNDLDVNRPHIVP